MTDTHGAGNCLWATPTLFLEAPLWLEFTDRPLSCVHGATPSILGLASCLLLDATGDLVLLRGAEDLLALGSDEGLPSVQMEALRRL